MSSKAAAGFWSCRDLGSTAEPDIYELRDWLGILIIGHARSWSMTASTALPPDDIDQLRLSLGGSCGLL
jgi:hypothetical protein